MMLDTQMLESGIAALSVRLRSVEAKLEGFEERIRIRENLEKDAPKRLSPEMATAMASQLSPICDKIARIEAQMALKQRLSLTEALPPTIEVPQDLRMIPGKNGKKQNRTAEVVQRRWHIWQMQHSAGIPLNAIARAWGCDHGSICYAKAQGWKVGTNERRRKKR